MHRVRRLSELYLLDCTAVIALEVEVLALSCFRYEFIALSHYYHQGRIVLYQLEEILKLNDSSLNGGNIWLVNNIRKCLKHSPLILNLNEKLHNIHASLLLY